VAWAKSRFEEYFSSQVELLAHLRGLVSSTSTTSTDANDGVGSGENVIVGVDRARAWLNTLSTDQLSNLLKVIQYQPWTTEGARKVRIHVFVMSVAPYLLTHSPFLSQWAVSEFQTLFFEEPTALLRENPIDSKDEEGRPFWGG